MRRVALAVLLAGCVQLPAGLERVHASDVPVAELRAAWTAAGREWPRDLPELERVHVALMTTEEVAAGCSRPVRACHLYGRDLLELPRVNIYVDAERHAPPDREKLIIHELLHLVRGRWVQEAQGEPYYSDRMLAGRVDPSCRHLTQEDSGHCDRELWLDIELDAIRRRVAR